MQKERPILFSTDMVIATLEDRKTKTRRTRGLDLINENPNDYKPYDRVCSFASGDEYGMGFIHKKTKENVVVKSPYGYKGDLLWVKETFKPSQFAGNKIDNSFDYKADHVMWLEKNGQTFTKNSGCEYTEHWKSSRFMPKEAARIWLEVLDVRVERLQNISEEDAESEGILIDDEGLMCFDYVANCFRDITPKESFKSLWIKINGEESWNQNVWVWVISFKVLSKTGKKNILINE